MSRGPWEQEPQYVQGGPPQYVQGGPPDYYERRPPTGSNGAITAVAVLNFVYAGLSLICGLLLFIGGALFASEGSRFEREFGGSGATSAGVGALVILLALVALGHGGGSIAGGVGVLNRRQWGRILSLVLAGVAILLALLSLIATFQPNGAANILGVLLYLGYAVPVLILLLNPENARYFS
jgi:hypothetical protein